MGNKIELYELGNNIVKTVDSLIEKSNISCPHSKRIIADSVAIVIERVVRNHPKDEWDSRLKKATFMTVPLIHAFVENLVAIADDKFVEKSKEFMEKMTQILSAKAT